MLGAVILESSASEHSFTYTAIKKLGQKVLLLKSNAYYKEIPIIS